MFTTFELISTEPLMVRTNKFVLTWIVPIVTGVIATLVYDGIKQVAVLSTLKSLLFWTYDLLLMFLNFNIKVWWLLSAIVLLFIIIKLFTFLDEKVEDDDEAILKNIPDYLYYQADDYGGFNWSWDWWLVTLTRKFEIVDLAPVCADTNCNYNKLTPESIRSVQTFYKCNKCNRRYTAVPSAALAEQAIIKKVQTNRYLKTTNKLSEGLLKAIKESN